MPKKTTSSKKDVEEVKVLAVVPSELNSKNLATVMTEEAQKRSLLTKYISHHMKVDVDYGKIQMGGGRESKPSLFKPGSEKFLSLFKLTATFKKDGDTWEMAGSIPGLFCYVCQLKTSKGVVVGEGRGSANLKEKNNWTVNNAVKIAEKRAQIDAVLRTGALSDFFTQDLEDMAQQSAQSYEPRTETIRHVQHQDHLGNDVEDTPPMVQYQATSIPETYTEQKTLIAAILKKRGVDFKDPKAAERYVADYTGLALVEGNYAKIISELTA